MRIDKKEPSRAEAHARGMGVTDGVGTCHIDVTHKNRGSPRSVYERKHLSRPKGTADDETQTFRAGAGKGLWKVKGVH